MNNFGKLLLTILVGSSFALATPSTAKAKKEGKDLNPTYGSQTSVSKSGHMQEPGSRETDANTKNAAPTDKAATKTPEKPSDRKSE
jgi:hypothetical protein